MPSLRSDDDSAMCQRWHTMVLRDHLCIVPTSVAEPSSTRLASCVSGIETRSPPADEVGGS